jgi:hypothetical protein
LTRSAEPLSAPMPIDLPEATPEHLVAVVDYAVMQPGVDVGDCAAFADIIEDHASRALDAAVLLGLLEPHPAGGYRSAGVTADLLSRGSRDQKRQIFRTHLERFEPFAYVRTRMIQGFDLLQSCREARARFDVSPTPAVIRDVFSRWGLYARSFVGDPPEVDTSHGIDAQVATVIDAILDEHAAAEEILSDELGPHLYIGLDQGVRDNLLAGIRKFRDREDPRSIAQPLGIAFEDFLRGVAGQHQIDVSANNGIVQVGNALRADGRITKKHLGLVQSIGAMRTAVEHGIDQDEDKEWSISAQAVRLLLAEAILAVKSISAYNNRGELEL